MNKSEIVGLLCDYGAAKHNNSQFVAASVAFRRATAMDPHSAAAWNGLGASLMNLGDLTGAEAALVKSRALDKTSSNSLTNYGLVLAARGEYKHSIDTYRQALQMKPATLATRWDMACALLDCGRWEEGLQLYECRMEYRGEVQYPKMPYPMWEGQSLDGKTIVIQAEQGIGDRILASRYIHWLKQQYDVRIIYSSKANMHSLMWEFVRDGIFEILPDQCPWPDADYGLFEMSLMRLYGSRPSNVPDDPGLILRRAVANATAVNLPPPHTPGLKVGICWTGNPEQSRNFERTIPLEKLITLAQNPNLTLYSLQMGPGGADVERLGAEELLCDLSAGMVHGLHATASMMLNLDVVVTACTSIAHLAGSLGVPTKVMLCHNPYWVWLRGRSDSPWYPSVKLYRQPSPGDWDSVISEVRRDLDAESHQVIKAA